MQLQKVNRRQVRIKMAFTGPSGSGKTYSSLLLAYGLTRDWSKIGLIDTENSSSSLYAHLGEFNVISLNPPFSPESYASALDLCEKEGLEVVIIDSITHCWEYLLDVHSNMVGNSFTNWGKITPRHNAFVQKMLQHPAHVIATMRTKTEYVLSEKNGKFVPEKMGMKSIQRDGMDYEFTLVFDLDIKHQASVSKDRTSLFASKQPSLITESTGEEIMHWCDEGSAEGDISKRILECRDMKTLMELYTSLKNNQGTYIEQFKRRKAEISSQPLITTSVNPLNNEPPTRFSQLEQREEERND
jgi:hypothetical protein